MAATLVDKVRAFSDEHQLFTQGSVLIVGLSGGPDSVALLSLLKKLEPFYHYTIIAAHLDHQWRATSHKDVFFCKEIAASHNVTFVHTTADQITLLKKPRSQEDRGRLLRRQYFEHLLKEYQASAIALGHHYHDQQETFFLRMIRGASIAGLAGMKPKLQGYIRPLLFCPKDELLSYLLSEQLPFLIDETNDNQKFLRNAIRHNVIPALKACDNRFDESFLKAFTALQETEGYLERVTHMTLKELRQAHMLDLEKFLVTDTFLHHRILVQWLCEAQVPFTPSTAFFNELMRFMQNNSSEHQVHPSWKLIKSGKLICIEKMP